VALLWVTLHTASGAAAGTHFAAYDGNGNVVGLVSATTGTETARYEYGPFGEPIRVSGPAAVSKAPSVSRPSAPSRDPTDRPGPLRIPGLYRKLPWRYCAFARLVVR
jgi:hypothetical protein